MRDLRTTSEERRRGYLPIALTAIFLIASLALVRVTARFVEAREGVVLADPVLAAFPPIELNVPIFSLVYGSVVLGLAMLARTRRLLIGLQAYALLMLLRCGTLWLVPLEAPSDMITLSDPIVQTFLQAERPPEKDLFFSGHVATAFLLFLLSADGWTKQLLLAATFLIALLIALQHVHYIIDLAAAPFFALGSYRAVLFARRS